MTGNIGLELSQFSPFIQDGSFEMKNNVVATMITLTICASFPVIAVSAQTNPNVAPDAVTQKMWPGAEYKIPGRIEGNTGFISESEAPKKSNKKYPAWFRGMVRMESPTRMHYIGIRNLLVLKLTILPRV